MNTKSTRSKASVAALNTNSPALSKSAHSKMPTFGGITLPEIAVLGAAGFVVWKNREKIQSLLEEHGISVPSFLSGDLSELIQSGVSAIANREQSASSRASSRRHDA